MWRRRASCVSCASAWEVIATHPPTESILDSLRKEGGVVRPAIAGTQLPRRGGAEAHVHEDIPPWLSPAHVLGKRRALRVCRVAVVRAHDVWLERNLPPPRMRVCVHACVLTGAAMQKNAECHRARIMKASHRKPWQAGAVVQKIRRGVQFVT